MAKESHMTNQDPKPGDGGPVQADPTKGVRFPEDELAELEAKADKEAKLETGADVDEPVEEPTDDDASVTKLSEFMKKKGINDIGKIVDLASDLESKNTKLSQEIARLSAIQRSPAGPGVVQPLGQPGRPVATVDDDIVLPENPIELVTNPQALKTFVKNLKQSIRDEAARGEQERTFGSIQARVQAKLEANPEEFRRLRPYMLELSRENPNADIDQLYDAAKVQYSSERKSLVSEIKAELGLTGNETERLKAIVGRVRQTPITGGTGVQVTQTPGRVSKEDADLLKAIATADKY